VILLPTFDPRWLYAVEIAIARGVVAFVRFAMEGPMK
jgi:hypothetical protein